MTNAFCDVVCLTFEDQLNNKYGEETVNLARCELEKIKLIVMGCLIEHINELAFSPDSPSPRSSNRYLASFARTKYIEYIKNADYIDTKVGVCLFEMLEDWTRSKRFLKISKCNNQDCDSKLLIEEYLELRDAQQGNAEAEQ